MQPPRGPPRKGSDPHPHMNELLDLSNGFRAQFPNVSPIPGLRFAIAEQRNSSYVILRSQGGRFSYLLLVPEGHFWIPSLGYADPSELTVFHSRSQGGGRVVNILRSSEAPSTLEIKEAGVPFNLDDFFCLVANKKLIFLPREQVKDLHRSHLLTSRGSPLFSSAFTCNERTRVYDVDVTAECFALPLFHHFKDTSKLLKKISRKKTVRHLRLFFTHLKFTVNSVKLENAIFNRTMSQPSAYARLFMSILKYTARSLKSKLGLDEGPTTTAALQPKRPRLSPPHKNPLDDGLLHFLTVNPIFAQRHFICPHCYQLKVSKESLLAHWSEVHYKKKIISFVASFWKPNSNQICNQIGCSVETISQEDMVNHLGLDHELAFQLFIKESQDKLRTCLVRGCSFLTLGVESLMNHMVFTHHYEALSGQMTMVQVIHDLSPNQCPIFFCQKFFMKEKLLKHYALEHGVLCDFLDKPSNDEEILIQYYETLLYTNIKTNFLTKYTCDLAPCHHRPVFSYYIAYLIHLAEAHYAEDLKSQFKDMSPGKCIYGNCEFRSSENRTLILHTAVNHEVVLSIDFKKRKKPMERFNSNLLRMYDGILRMERRSLYSHGSRVYKYITSLYASLKENQECSPVHCLACRVNIRSLPDSEPFYEDLIYHALSKQHIHNTFLLSNEDKNTYEPLPPLNDKEGNFCHVCGVSPDPEHHLRGSHQNGLFSFSKFNQFCTLRGVNPLSCSLSEIVHFVEYLRHGNEQLDLKECLSIISRFHQKGSALFSSKEFKKCLSKPPSKNPKTLYTCILCMHFAPTYDQMKEHLLYQAHSANDYMRCEACSLFFKGGPFILDIHRHSQSHLSYEYNLLSAEECPSIPIKKKVLAKEIYNCNICDVKITSSELAGSHASSSMHIKIQELADAYYAYCRSLKVSPVTCDVSALKPFLLDTEDISHRRDVWKLLTRIHEGMDIAERVFGAELNLL